MRLLQIIESKDKLTLVDLPYEIKELDPVMESNTVKYHYGTLSKGYVDRYNTGEGDPEFNKAGALLHNVWWPQLRSAKGSNRPSNKSLEFIEKHYNSFEDFRDQFNDIANTLQGSGWCYLAKNGEIKLIQNHKWKNDIILLIDLWEHSFNAYETRKDYLKKIWRLINWNVINDRLNASSD
jgi:superoxide dismutase, Fe-Mn family